MSDRLTEFDPTTDVALITFSDPARLQDYRDGNRLRFPVLTDRTRRTYRAYGLGRGSVRRVYGLRTLSRYVQILRDEGVRGLARPVEDTLQLGGDFVVGPDGTLRYAYWSKGPDDRPSIDDLLQAVQPGD